MTPPSSSKEVNEAIGGCIASLFMIPILLVAGLYSVWVTGVVWGWFLTPTYGWPVPPFAVLYGMFIIKGLFFSNYKFAEIKAREGLSPAATYGPILFFDLSVPTLALFVGWIFHFWVP